MSALTALFLSLTAPTRSNGRIMPRIRALLATFRIFLARAFPRTPRPPRQSEIESALLRAMGGV